MRTLESGETFAGYTIDSLLHRGGMADLYRVRCADAARQPDFPLLLKVPRLGSDADGENLVGFETERRVLAALRGAHVPRWFDAGDIARPYLALEFIAGETLEQRLERKLAFDAAALAQTGAAVARALHALHLQGVCHEDLKPANVLLREDGSAVLLDFGLAWHTAQPDLIGAEQRLAGSNAWIAPEQIVGIRGDPRSDIFALGVILYELATGGLPFGNPQSAAGLRQRLWMQPLPPRGRNPAVPAWLQEIILTCLEAQAERRYASAALLAFDLAHPDEVAVGARGNQLRAAGIGAQLARWRARGKYRPSPLPTPAAPPPPIVMVALPHRDVTPAIRDALARAAERSLGTRPGARLACVTVVAPGAVSEAALERRSLHQELLKDLRAWVDGLARAAPTATCHVLEASDVAQALLAYASANHVDLIVLGAATHGLQLQRLIATVPIKVAMHAPCTVVLVKG